MEGKRNLARRKVSRRYEASRLEDQVWALAYEQVWPWLHRIPKESGATSSQKPAVASQAAVELARSA